MGFAILLIAYIIHDRGWTIDNSYITTCFVSSLLIIFVGGEKKNRKPSPMLTSEKDAIVKAGGISRKIPRSSLKQ